jgi:hypothetical protein
MMRVLVACEFSGIVRKAFRAQGHEAWSCDLLPSEDDGEQWGGRQVPYPRPPGPDNPRLCRDVYGRLVRC